jgi:hypothetical protein
MRKGKGKTNGEKAAKKVEIHAVALPNWMICHDVSSYRFFTNVINSVISKHFNFNKSPHIKHVASPR